MRGFAAALTCCAAFAATAGAADPNVAGPELIRTYCSGCHHEHDGAFERISAIRKTPEGWAMSLVRMRQEHGLALDPAARDSIVRYLSDTQGLAPSESAAGRFALERVPNAQDLDLGPELGVMCGRCHSLARSALQRRGEEEWRKLAHTHVGQWPSIEYSASGRDRPWFQIATGPLPARLAALYPFDSQAWRDWRAHGSVEPAGDWVVFGHVPGGVDFFGLAHIERSDVGRFAARYELTGVDGRRFGGESTALLYTGYEWRGNATLDGHAIREVYAASEDGQHLSGRWFDPDHAEDGGEWRALRASTAPQVLAVLPRALRAGSSAELTIVGTGLATLTPAFGEGITVRSLRREPTRIVAQLEVASGATPGERSIFGTAAPAGLIVYRQIDAIAVSPAYGIARIGGGRIDPVTAQFEARASTRLADGTLLDLGPMGAQWISLPHDETARRAEDEKFAGHFDQRGRFFPNSAGPNPQREFSGDNVGDLTVLARIADGERTLEGKAHLIVTVQRWNTPPIY